MKQILLYALLLVLFTACTSYQKSPSPKYYELYSPAYPSEPQVYTHPAELPSSLVVVLNREYLSTQKSLQPEILSLLRQRSLDGALVLNSEVSSHNFSEEIPPSFLSYVWAVLDTNHYPEPRIRSYTETHYHASFQPFIFLDSINNRAYLDRIVLDAIGPEGDSSRYEFSFNWHAQLSTLPKFIKSDHFEALALQPWFFMHQSKKGWEDALNNIGMIKRRRFRNAGYQVEYIPQRINGRVKVRFKKSRYELILGNENRRSWQIEGVNFRGKPLVWKNESFLGRMMRQTFIAGNGIRYHYRYYYKTSNDVPKEWIKRPVDLQH